MSSAPPPGWYRDPSYPLTERWWDGTAWSDHRRTPAGAPVTAPAPAPAAPPPVPPAGRPGRTRVIALTAAGAVLAASAVTAALLLRDDGSGRDVGGDPAPARTGTTNSPAPGGSTDPSDAAGPPSADPNVVADDLNGITFPLLDGWTRPTGVTGDDLVMVTPGTYDCPGDPGLCRHGRVLSRTVTANDEKSPKALALTDIEDAAHDAYDRDALEARPYGGVTGHEQTAAGPVGVAGRAGYMVRWRVTTEEGPGGHVQSVAFPASRGSGSLVIVRIAVDAGKDAPPVADLDRITKGIRPLDDADTGGGVGSSIGP